MAMDNVGNGFYLVSFNNFSASPHAMTKFNLYFRRDGTPYPDGDEGMFEWAKDFENKKRRIAHTRLWWGGWVSTVWLGIDHSFGSMPLPQIFESMVFGDSSFMDLDIARFASESSAKVGHALLVKKWKDPIQVTDALWEIAERRAKE